LIGGAASGSTVRMPRLIIGATIFCLAAGLPARATTYHVAQFGADGNNGVTRATPFQHIARAVNAAGPGDTICIDDNGTYNNVTEATENSPAVVRILTSGLPGSPITLKACDNARPTIDNTANSYYGIGHHIAVTGNEVEYEGCSGIAGSPDQYRRPYSFDYIDITKNATHQNAFYSAAGCSGISLYELTNFDVAPGYHNHVSGNFSWGNRELVEESGRGHISDGNGCIIDDARHIQHPELGAAYTGATLVANNRFVGNGGTGCHAYQSDNIDFFYNTAFGNNRTPYLDQGCTDVTCSAELGGYNEVKNLRFYNNIVYAMNDDRQTIGCPRCIFSAGDYNVQFGGAGTAFKGAHDVMADPKLASLMLDGSGNVRLQAGSPAIGAADQSIAVSIDYYGASRPQGESYDIGAAEYIPPKASAIGREIP